MTLEGTPLEHDHVSAARAAELLDELGFLGVCELVEAFANKTEGSLSWKSHRVTVELKTRKAAERARAKFEAAHAAARRAGPPRPLEAK